MSSSSLRVRNKELDLSTPQIMGILNATPDSFSDGGEYNATDSALERISTMVDQGAAIIDIGGESTRPGSDPVSEQEEMDRVLPILEKAIPKFQGTLFSVDTTKYNVAKEALEKGAHVINDISGLQQEPRLAELCAEYKAGYILMHSQGDPKTMQHDPQYDDVIADITSFFQEKISKAEQAGVQTIIIDPGLGFGKTLAHNISILKNLQALKTLGHPLMIGASRKSMVGKILNGRAVDDRLIGTVALHYHAMLNGANLIRVHDVKEANDAILVYNALAGAG